MSIKLLTGVADILLLDMHRVLCLMPCSCTLRWVKDGSEREVIRTCQRCIMINKYEVYRANLHDA
jgi:hypothetical protein